MIVLLLGSAVGCLFMLVAAVIIRRSARQPMTTTGSVSAVTILKPLHGAEPGLFENLATFCRQDYAGAVQLVFGVSHPSDAAIPAVERLRTEFPERDIAIVIAPPATGTNPKVANLINMSGRIAHDIVVVADSDIRVPRHYLRQVVGALERQDGGAVTCPYYGIAGDGLWARLSRLNIDGHFLPSVVVGAAFRLSRPCLGSTIAMRRHSLAAIGGFQAVADCLADDYAIGEALAKRGEPVGLSPLGVGHMCAEASFAELWRHELRWALTVRTIDPLGYIGWTGSHAFPLAVIALCLGGGWPALSFAVAAVTCRSLLLWAVERGYDLPRHPYWVIPLRDLLSFAIFVVGFVVRDVRWKQQRYRLRPEGTLMPERRSPSP